MPALLLFPTLLDLNLSCPRLLSFRVLLDETLLLGQLQPHLIQTRLFLGQLHLSLSHERLPLSLLLLEGLPLSLESSHLALHDLSLPRHLSLLSLEGLSHLSQFGLLQEHLLVDSGLFLHLSDQGLLLQDLLLLVSFELFVLLLYLLPLLHHCAHVVLEIHRCLLRLLLLVE